MSDVVIRKAAIDAVIFDLDGVITRTAAVHRRAWKALFDRYLRTRADRSGEPFEPFTTADYGEYVDGKPRYDGVQSFLESRGIDLPWGDPADSPDEETVCGLGNRKNAEFLDVVAEDGVEPYESSVRFVRDLQAAGIGTALFSSSRNALAVLDAAGLGDLFSVVVDGRVGDDLGLPGKPDPAYLIEAASRLGATPERTAVVEDALSGVEAGKRGGFALVIGVDRIDQAAALHDNGADVVVADLAEARVAPEASRPMSELPNVLTAGHMCYVSRVASTLVTLGNLPICDYAGGPACIAARYSVYCPKNPGSGSVKGRPQKTAPSVSRDRMSITPGSKSARCRRIRAPMMATTRAQTNSFSDSIQSGTATLPVTMASNRGRVSRETGSAQRVIVARDAASP